MAGAGKILVVRGGAIGDFILTLPVLASLRKAFPEAGIEVLGYPRMAELAMAGGMIDGYRSIEARALAGFFARNGKLDSELGEFFGSFGVIFSYLYDPDEIFRTNVGRVSKALYYQGPHRPDESQPVHASRVLLQPLEKLAIFEADEVARLTLPGGAERMAGEAGWIAVHPGSGSERKNWPADRWESLLARLLRATTRKVLLAGGEAEGDRLDQLARRLPPGRVEVARNLPLAELGRLLARASLFLGHDSGISHLAAAVGARSLLLWGPSNAQIWRPLSPETRLLQAGEGLENLGVEEVWSALEPLLPTPPE